MKEAIKCHGYLQNAESSNTSKVITIQKVHVVTSQFNVIWLVMRNNENNRYKKLNQNNRILLHVFALDDCYYTGNIFLFGLTSCMHYLVSRL